MDISTLIDRLKNRVQGESFTPEEVDALIDWYVQHAVTDAERESWDEANAQANQAIVDKSTATMNQLLSLWDSTPMTPTLEVIAND